MIETNTRPLHEIARETLRNPSLKGNARTYAEPYLSAMLTLDNVTEFYGADSGRGIVAYALANLQTWRGDDARRIKAELKKLI